MTLNEIIRRLRESKGLTQQNLADELGVDITTVNRWESEGASVKNGALQKVASVFKMSVSDIYAYQDNPKLLEEPIAVYKKAENRVTIMVELDGTTATLNNSFELLKRLNAAL